MAQKFKLKLIPFPLDFEENVEKIQHIQIGTLQMSMRKEIKEQDFVMCSFLEFAYKISAPRFFSYAARLTSFSHWPLQMCQRKEELARVGFYSIQKGDKVSCFACGLTLWDWPSHVTPFEAHYWLNKNCRYLASIPSRVESKVM